MRALRRLIELAVSELEACAWKAGFSIGALPFDREPRPLTAAQRRALGEGRNRANRQRREEREGRERALEVRLAGARQ